MGLRSADFAGAWYPGNKSECRRAIEEYVKACLPCPVDIKDGIGGIVPHAGWFYSGLIACNVIKCLDRKDKPDTCIIFGRHLHPGGNNYIMTEGGWDTPLGELKIDAELAQRLAGEFPFKIETSDRYEQDNTIELQLPFIKYFFPGTRIVPMGLPPKAASLSIAARCARIAKDLGRSPIVLGSTDLTHYGFNYGYMPKGTGDNAVDWVKNENDKRVVDLMVKMDEKGVIEEALNNHNACCSGAAGASIAAAKELGAGRGVKITYSTSYDIRPDSSFVGYVGVVFST
jgi:hypothetical protein